MADRRGRRRRTPPKRALIGPLVMLASGAVVGVFLWRFLMLDGHLVVGRRLGFSEHLTQQDRRALDHLLDDGRGRP